MDDNGRNAASVHVLTFSPRIKGTRRSFKVRVMHWQGDLWLVTKDVGEAAGWYPTTFTKRRAATLTPDDWGYVVLPADHSGALMMMVNRHALVVMMWRTVGRQSRAFLRWLKDLEMWRNE